MIYIDTEIESPSCEKYENEVFDTRKETQTRGSTTCAKC